MRKSNFDKFPEITVEGYSCAGGWEQIREKLQPLVAAGGAAKKVMAVDCYHGVYTDEVLSELKILQGVSLVIDVREALLSRKEIDQMVFPYVTNDPVFGYITRLSLPDFFDPQKVKLLNQTISSQESGCVLVVGLGATLLAPKADLVLYADMPRWEIQLRFRANLIENIGADNRTEESSYQYKRAFFVDWRVCDKHKKTILTTCDFFLDTTHPGEPKMVEGDAIRTALRKTVSRPFRVVPFFDPGPWGGQWLKEVIDLDRSVQNFAWGFDCVPEENSLLFRIDGQTFEIPSIDLVFTHPKELLGDKVMAAFGDEFPIRFDFLDTMEGGNLSLQVHPMLEYIREKFGMGYTQDESYYFLEAREGAFVYLGLKDKIVPEEMITDLQRAQEGGDDFDAEKFVQKWPIQKHDHVLIPAGTVHCSGANSVVLEISATPYIFTFKLWDWGRMGLDGKPRPISLEHGKQAIQWERRSEWTKENLLGKVEVIGQGEGWKEERTGLHENSFIETRRHWFTGPVTHHTGGVFNVLNLIEGEEILVESPTGAFEPYVIHYAETFIVPASVGAYTIQPHGKSVGSRCATIKAYVRTQNLINYQFN